MANVCFMKNKVAAVLLFLLTVCCNHASAFDAYVYLNGSYVPVNVSENIYKMVFDTDYTYFITANNDTATLSNAAFSFITFRKVEKPVGMNAAKTVATTIVSENDGIRISSGKAIDAVRIIDSAGNIVADVSPSSNDLFFSTLGLPAGVYIVQASSGKEVSVKKITKNK